MKTKCYSRGGHEQYSLVPNSGGGIIRKELIVLSKSINWGQDCHWIGEGQCLIDGIGMQTFQNHCN